MHRSTLESTSASPRTVIAGAAAIGAEAITGNTSPAVARETVNRSPLDAVCSFGQASLTPTSGSTRRPT
jgi:hypothetical protein